MHFAKFLRTTLLVALACWLAIDPAFAELIRAALLGPPLLGTFAAGLFALTLAVAAVALHHATWTEPPVSNTAMVFNLLGVFVWGTGVVWCMAVFMLQAIALLLVQADRMAR